MISFKATAHCDYFGEDYGRQFFCNETIEITLVLGPQGIPELQEDTQTKKGWLIDTVESFCPAHNSDNQ